MKTFIVIDTFHTRFGENIFMADSRDKAEKFCEDYAEECDDLCKLQIVETEGIIGTYKGKEIYE